MCWINPAGRSAAYDLRKFRGDGCLPCPVVTDLQGFSSSLALSLALSMAVILAPCSLALASNTAFIQLGIEDLGHELGDQDRLAWFER